MRLFNLFKKEAAKPAFNGGGGAAAALLSSYGAAGITFGYEASAIVYAMVEKRAKLISAIPLKIERKNNKGEWETDSKHWLNKLFEKPNPYESFTELLISISQSVDIYGNAFIRQITANSAIDGGVTQELYLLPADKVEIKEGKTKPIEKYIYRDGAVKIEFDESEIIQIMLPNPRSRTTGMSVLKGAGIAIDIDAAIARWQKVSLNNRSLADIYIKVTPDTTKEQIEAIKESARNNIMGDKNARKPIITTGEIVNFGQSAAELDFTASRMANWREISMAFGVPLAAVGLTENVNLSNAETMERQIYQDTIQPLLRLYTIQLTAQLAPEGYRITPDYSSVPAMQESLDKKLERAQRLFSMGVPFNRLNEYFEMGLEPIEGGDIGYLTSGLIPAAMAAYGENDGDPEELAKEAYGIQNNKRN